MFISYLILKLYFFSRSRNFPLILTISVHFLSCSTKVAYLSHTIVALKNVRVVTTSDFLICYKMIVWIFRRFKHLQIIRILYSFSLSFCMTGIILYTKREITPIKKHNFRIKPGMCKWSIVCNNTKCILPVWSFLQTIISYWLVVS